jgi:hypothetical protein
MKQNVGLKEKNAENKNIENVIIWLTEPLLGKELEERRLGGWCEMVASLSVVSPVEFCTGGYEDRT